MGFNAPDQSTMEQARDQALQAHRSYWESKGTTLGNDYFPGYEAGWKAACDALSNGQGLPDAEAQGKSDEEWEYKHGFKQGAADAEKHGSN